MFASDAVTLSIVAAKSMWPESGCPPISAPSLAALSMLTAPKVGTPPSVVTRRLWKITSKRASTGEIISVTVRQQPSTATLAPIARSCEKPSGKRSSSVRSSPWSAISSIVATPWTIPVNIALSLSATAV